METINLLPKEVKVRDVKGIIFNVILIVLIIVFITLIATSVFLFDINEYIVPKLNDYKRINIQFHNYITKLEAYEQFKDKVNAKSELIDSLQKDEILWTEVLYDFGKKVPDNAYINYIDGSNRLFYEFIDKSSEEKQKQIEKILFFNVGGYAVNETDIAKFVIEIRDIPGVDKVLINNISKSQIAGYNADVSSFNISAYCDLKPYLEDSGGEKKTQTEQIKEEEDLLESELESFGQ